MTRWGAALVCAGLALGTSGCRHRVRIAPLPPVLVPMPLIDVPRPATAPMLTSPSVKMPPVPVASRMTRLPREHRRAQAKPEEAVQPPAPTPAAEAAAIGSLTAGGTTNPQAKQDASNLIASNERRLAALPAQRVDEQKGEISTVRNFEKQAQDALNSGDAEGAMTLATKAKLLLDDLEK